MSDALVVESSGSSGGNSGAPATFADAFAADASPTSAPTPTPDAPPGAVSPEAEAVDASHPAGEDDRSPFIPRARFDEVNTKLKELREWRESRAWAESVQPEHFQTMAQWFLRAQQDTRGFALGLLDEMIQSPEHAAAIRSELARRLGTRQASPATDDGPPQPDIDVTDGQGNVVGRTYSDRQLAKRDEFLRKQMLQEVDAKYAPHLKTLETVQQERQQLALRQQADQFGKTFADQLAALPLFAEHKAEIGKALASKRLESDHPDAVRAAAYQAYLEIVTPKLQAGTQQAVVADLQRKAHASTSVNPASAGASTPKRPASFHDAALEW